MTLKSISLPRSLTVVEWGSFDLCPSLKDVYYAGTLADRQDIEIGGDNYWLSNASWRYRHNHTLEPKQACEATCVSDGLLANC